MGPELGVINRSMNMLRVCLLRLLFALMLVFASVFFSTAQSIAQAAEARVAVASNFMPSMRVLVEHFEQLEHSAPYKIKLAQGSSGKFVAQIKNGAPFDLFFSADSHKVEVLKHAGLIVSDSEWTYAIGRLVLITNQWLNQQSSQSNKSNKKYFSQGQNVLLRLEKTAFNKIAIANPELAPYGKAAKQTLKKMGLLEKTQDHWVQGENIAQTYQFVHSGNADLGFIALAQLNQDQRTQQIEQSSIWIVPENYHEPIIQKAALLKRAKRNEAAIAFLNFVQSVAGRRVIESFSYKTLP